MDHITISSKSRETSVEPSVYANWPTSPTTLKTAGFATLIFTALSSSAVSFSAPLNLLTFGIITGITTVATYLLFRIISRQQPLNNIPKPSLTPPPKTETSEPTTKPISETVTLPKLKKESTESEPTHIILPKLETSETTSTISLVMNDAYIMICVQSDEKPAVFDLDGNLVKPLRRPFERLTRIKWQDKFVIVDEKTGKRDVMPQKTVQNLLENAVIGIRDGVMQIVIMKR